MIVNLKVTFNDDGTANITLPEGKTMKMDAMKVAAFTKRLAEQMGTITERHLGLSHEVIAQKDVNKVSDGQ